MNIQEQSNYRCLSSLIVDGVKIWKALAEFVHCCDIWKTEIPCNFFDRTLARQKDVLVERLLEHSKWTVRHHHLIHINLQAFINTITNIFNLKQNNNWNSCNKLKIPVHDYSNAAAITWTQQHIKSQAAVVAVVVFPCSVCLIIWAPNFI